MPLRKISKQSLRLRRVKLVDKKMMTMTTYPNLKPLFHLAVVQVIVQHSAGRKRTAHDATTPRLKRTRRMPLAS